MISIEGKWAGRIFGTNTGKLFCEFKLENDKIVGTVRLNDDSIGLLIFSASGVMGKFVELKLTQISEELGFVKDPFIIDFKLSIDNFGNIIGDWISKNGYAGTLELFPHKNIEPEDGSTEPQQIFGKSIKLGSLRLFRRDIEEIIKQIKKDFSNSRVVVSYSRYGSDIAKYADDFLSELDEIKELRAIKFSVQDIPSNQLSRIINIDLLQRTESEIRISGPNDSWVLGKAESLKMLFSPFTNKVNQL